MSALGLRLQSMTAAERLRVRSRVNVCLILIASYVPLAIRDGAAVALLAANVGHTRVTSSVALGVSE